MIPEFPNFKKIELSDREDVEKITQQFPPYSDFNFVSLYSWNVGNKVEISQYNNNLLVKFTDYSTNQPFYSLIGNNKLVETIKLLLNKSHSDGMESVIKLVPETVVSQIDYQFVIQEDRDNFDYIYHIPDLCAGAGKKYEDYRNMLNRFNKRYADFVSVKYLPLKFIKKDILDLNEIWKKNKDQLDSNKNGFKHDKELEAIKRIFDIDEKNIIATCIFFKDKLIGYSINELIPGEYALCHFSKADISFAGISSFLMKKNCEMLLSIGKTKLNYEQDLGLPNLRFSKNSFQPQKLLVKYLIS